MLVPDGVVATFVGLPSVEAVLGRGPHKAAVKLGGRGPQIDLMVMRPGEAGTYLIHFTGSKEHNVRLRERARGQAEAEYVGPLPVYSFLEQIPAADTAPPSSRWGW